MHQREGFERIVIQWQKQKTLLPSRIKFPSGTKIHGQIILSIPLLSFYILFHVK